MDDDDDYRFYPTVDYSDYCLPPTPMPLPDHLFSHRPSAPPVFCDRNTPIFGADHIFSSSSSSSSDSASTPRNSSDDGISAATRAKIAAHPLYPKLLRAFMDCQKVGAPSDTADVFDEMLGGNDHHHLNRSAAVSSSEVADPELDEFMESYCDLLFKYKSEFEKPFNEATAFLNSMETKLSNLCSGGDGVSGEATESSDEDFSAAGEPPVQEYRRRGEDRELKDMLLHKYSGYISSLKNEFSRHKKKGKLPKEARQVLLDWWTVHCRWPYPTETDKVALAESTGLDQKQINNWFINQRKRHWRPSENMHFSGMDSLYRPFFCGD